MSRQEEILAFIACHIAEKGYSPTVREIGKAVGLKSSSTVMEHLRKLENKGLIRHTPKLFRSIVIAADRPDLPEVIKTRKGIPTIIIWQGRRYVYYPVGVR